MMAQLTVNRKGKARLAPTIALSATLGLALAFTLSCHDGGGDDNNGGTGEGITATLDLEAMTDSSLTIVNKRYNCLETGQLEERIDRGIVPYSINGTILSFRGLEFNGNQSSLIGTWTRDAYASCEERKDGCEVQGISKMVFTENSCAVTMCIGKIGEYKRTDENGVVIEKRKIIDCSTEEKTRGEETVRIRYSETETTATYNDKTCTSLVPSKFQMEKACNDAYDRVKTENPVYDGNGRLVYDYYDEFLYDTSKNCPEKNGFPEWFH